MPKQAMRHLLLLIILSGIAFATHAAPKADGHATGHILVKPAAGLSSDKFDKLLRRANARSKRQLRSLPVHIVEVPPQAEQAVARALANNPHVAFAELDRRVAPDASVNDPDYPKQWHLPLMGADAAWATSSGEGIVVAVLDTGVNGNHVDLSGQVLRGWNTVSNNTDTADINNHGTWVAGIIAAKINNLAGGASVAPASRILPVRITNESAGWAYFSDMAEGITWAADNGAQVANLSYGGAAGSATVASAATYMMGKGGVVMVAAGNDNTDYGYTNHASLYVAAATTSSDSKASYSSYGSFVDIAAPGSGIYTTSRSGGYSTVNGTSFASPNAAATAALVISANPALLPTDVLAVLGNTAVDLGSSGWDPVYGHGRIDTRAAVELAASVETSDRTAPTVAVLSPGDGSEVSELVAVGVEASDAFGVARVDLLVDGRVVASDTQPVDGNDYRFSWDSTTVADGQHRLSARAIDAAGNSASASDIQVQVANNDDAIAPEVTIHSPGDGSSGTKSVTLSASASDNIGVTQISIYAGGKLKCAATSSVSCNWNLRKEAEGSYTISAVATDAAGNQGTAAVSFTVGGSADSDDGSSKTPPGGGKGRFK